MMQHNRKPNRRKMLKPKFDSSSSDDDFEQGPPLKWKPIVASFPIESNNLPKTKQSNPIIDCLNSQTAKQQKLSAEIIQKEEIYNQAELEANKRMFGCTNPGRCLSKDEIRHRKDVILNIVNERLKSKLSQLMGEFGQRIEMNDSDASDTSNAGQLVSRNHSSTDDDSLPEAPPPPTFTLSSDSSDNEVKLSMTKQFELYEKEIKEKISKMTSVDDPALEKTSTLNKKSAAKSFETVQICPSNPIPPQPVNIPPENTFTAGTSQNWNHLLPTSTNNYQQNWQLPMQMQQWPMTEGQSHDTTAWIPPVGPPQTMEPFPPPIGAEQISSMGPTQHIPTFTNTPPPGWMPPILHTNYGAVPQYPPPHWNNSQSTPYATRPSFSTARPQRPGFQTWNEMVGRPQRPGMKWSGQSYRAPGSYIRPRVSYTETMPIRPSSSVISARPQIRHPFKSTSNANISIVSKSTYVNALLADQKLGSVNQNNELKSNQQVTNGSIDEKWNQFKSNEKLEGDPQSRKRPYDASSVFDVNVDTSKSNENEQSHKKVSEVKKSRFDNCTNDNPSTEKSNTLPENQLTQIKPISHADRRSASLEHKFISQNEHRRKSLERKEVDIGSQKKFKKSPELEERHEKTNAETFKFLSKFRNAQNITNSTSTSDLNNQPKQPIEWTKLCNIVDKLLDLSPSILKDLSPSDRRIKERNEVLMILSDDPAKFFSFSDKYGEHNVAWSVKLAQRILFPNGRYDDRIAAALAPFRNSIQIPKEWDKLCKIVDRLLDVPTLVMDNLPMFDSRIKERNEVLMILSNDPEDFLLCDDKYGSHNVDWVILAAKRILCPDGIPDERVRRIMLCQREILLEGQRAPNQWKTSEEKSPHSDVRSRILSQPRNTTSSIDHGSRSQISKVPNEWNDLCDIVDKVLNIPYDVRIKLSKRDPRWQLRDNFLLILSEDPDKFLSQSEEYGSETVKWAIKSAKKLIFPNGSKDKTVMKKLSPQRNTLLRDRKSCSVSPKDKLINGDKISKVNQATGEEKTTNKDETNKGDEFSTDGKASKRTEAAVKEAPKQNQVLKEGKVHKEDKVLDDKSAIKGQKAKEQQDTKRNQPATVVPDCNASNAAVIEAAYIEVDVTQVWGKLCKIVDKLLDIPQNADDILPSSDKRLNERNEILMILSDEPDNFAKFDANYGSANVSWAIKSAKKLIYRNGKLNEKLTDTLWKERDAIMCLENPNPDTNEEPPTNNNSPEWIHIRKIATKVFQYSIKNIESEKKSSKELLYQRIELLLQLSDDPEIARTKPISKKIGEGRLEVAIAKCKHILNRIRKQDPQVLFNFEYHRSRMTLYLESQNQSKKIKNYDLILGKVRQIVDRKLFYEIFGNDFNKWTKEQKLERNELAILLIKDPTLLKSNVKYSEKVLRTENGATDDIVADIEKCLLECDFVKEKSTESKEIVACDVPIIVKIKDTKYMTPFNQRKLTQRIHRLIEQFLIPPKPEVFDIQYDKSDGTVDVVCANLMTFKWLKSSINEFDGLWSDAKLKIVRVPRNRKMLALNDLKQIKMLYKNVPAESFQDLLKQLKKSNSRLNTERWKVPSKIPINFADCTTMFVLVDLESLIELERLKRTIHVDNGTVYFDIKYIGMDNFETKY